MLEIEVINMSEAGAATVLGEIETLVVDYIKEKGLRRMVDVMRNMK
jgi:hypothetical protein